MFISTVVSAWRKQKERFNQNSLKAQGELVNKIKEKNPHKRLF